MESKVVMCANAYAMRLISERGLPRSEILSILKASPTSPHNLKPPTFLKETDVPEVSVPFFPFSWASAPRGSGFRGHFDPESEPIKVEDGNDKA